ncbi:hypothetical protein ASF92_01505 [Pedobacter sp. Leaf176]|nr:hypothetical protein ASF92_01505 [Pedobacter sp. Leaf176]
MKSSNSKRIKTMIRLFKPILVALVIIIMMNCRNVNHLIPLVDPTTILANSDQTTNYIAEYVNFEATFQPLDTEGREFSRKAFLEQIRTGNYLPVKIKSVNSIYQLYKINMLIEDAPKYYLIDQARQGLFQLSLIGKEAPKFDFVDLNGNAYKQKDMEGKILVMKFWFIGCVACIEEMPAVNKIVDEFHNRKDIVFVSLASDNAAKLRKFLKNVTFKYQTVANADPYMIDSIGTTVFPSHLIIGKDGKIRKFTTQYAEVEKELKSLQ